MSNKVDMDTLDGPPDLVEKFKANQSEIENVFAKFFEAQKRQGGSDGWSPWVAVPGTTTLCGKVFREKGVIKECKISTWVEAANGD